MTTNFPNTPPPRHLPCGTFANRMQYLQYAPSFHADWSSTLLMTCTSSSSISSSDIIWSSTTFGGSDKSACSVDIESSCAASVGCIDACVSTLVHSPLAFVGCSKKIECRSIVYELWIFCPLPSLWHTVSCHFPSI